MILILLECLHNKNCLLHSSPSHYAPPSPPPYLTSWDVWNNQVHLFFSTFQYACTSSQNTSWTSLCNPFAFPTLAHFPLICQVHAQTLKGNCEYMPLCFRCCVVLQMPSFYDCAASLRLTHMNLCAMSMIQLMPKSKVKTICILENVRGLLLVCTMMYVLWSDELC